MKLNNKMKLNPQAKKYFRKQMNKNHTRTLIIKKKNKIRHKILCKRDKLRRSREKNGTNQINPIIRINNVIVKKHKK